MRNKAIGVFDSGLGGLTAVKELKRILPGEEIVFFGDTARVPYGSRSPETIREYALQDIRFLLSQNVKMLVAACGTVSSVLQQEDVSFLTVPFLTVIHPAAKAACAVTRNQKIGVIGTEASIRSRSYEKAICEMLPGTQVIGKACPLFVPLVESGMRQQNESLVRQTISTYLQAFRGSDIDTLILGCTHYPLIEDLIGQEIDRQIGHSVQLISPGKEAACCVENILNQQDLRRESAGVQSRYYVSDTPHNFEKLASHFLGESIQGQVFQVKIDEIAGKELSKD